MTLQKTTIRRGGVAVLGLISAILLSSFIFTACDDDSSFGSSSGGHYPVKAVLISSDETPSYVEVCVDSVYTNDILNYKYKVSSVEKIKKIITDDYGFTFADQNLYANGKQITTDMIAKYELTDVINDGDTVSQGTGFLQDIVVYAKINEGITSDLYSLVNFEDSEGYAHACSAYYFLPKKYNKELLNFYGYASNAKVGEITACYVKNGSSWEKADSNTELQGKEIKLVLDASFVDLEDYFIYFTYKKNSDEVQYTDIYFENNATLSVSELEAEIKEYFSSEELLNLKLYKNSDFTTEFASNEKIPMYTKVYATFSTKTNS